MGEGRVCVCVTQRKECVREGRLPFARCAIEPAPLIPEVALVEFPPQNGDCIASADRAISMEEARVSVSVSGRASESTRVLVVRQR